MRAPGALPSGQDQGELPSDLLHSTHPHSATENIALSVSGKIKILQGLPLILTRRLSGEAEVEVGSMEEVSIWR